MADKVPQLRKGLTREDLLRNTRFEKFLKGDGSVYKPSEVEMAALHACLPLLDALIARVESGDRVSQRTVTEFFSFVEQFADIRSLINIRIKKGELTPTVLDKLVQDI